MNLVSHWESVVRHWISLLFWCCIQCCTYIQYTVKYHRAKKSVKNYYGELTRLEKMYSREEKKFAGREMSGGYKK